MAVDGSPASDLAFSVAMDGLYRNNIDKFHVVTITNSKKENIPFNFRPEYIEDRYLAKIFMIPNTGSAGAHFIKREISHTENKTTKETVYEIAQELKATVLVCGMHGRKGPKA